MRKSPFAVRAKSLSERSAESFRFLLKREFKSEKLKMQIENFVEKIINGELRFVARAISKVEDGTEDAAELMKVVFPRTGRALVIGITGSPGAGKSSLVDKLALYYREQGERIGIVCVDPSSPFSGGAILGDRIRMQTLGLED